MGLLTAVRRLCAPSSVYEGRGLLTLGGASRQEGWEPVPTADSAAGSLAGPLPRRGAGVRPGSLAALLAKRGDYREDEGEGDEEDSPVVRWRKQLTGRRL